MFSVAPTAFAHSKSVHLEPESPWSQSSSARARSVFQRATLRLPFLPFATSSSSSRSSANSFNTCLLRILVLRDKPSNNMAS